MSAEWVQAIAGVATMLAAIAALIIAAKTPRLAAQWAEQYRRETAEADAKRQIQLNVFYALMKSRVEILNVDARAAINLVDVVFSDNLEVRSARNLFIQASLKEPFEPNVMVERYHQLIESVARAVGLGSAINGFDIRQGYYPEAMAKLDQAAVADAEARLAAVAAAKAKVDQS
ncbi:DUF6680 family protein [Sphingomonas sp. CJ99]